MSGYSQRQPAKTIVWQTVHKHWQAYRAETARCHEGRPPPAFVEAAAKKFLACGFHSSGFARIRCTSCGDDLIVPFSPRVACRQWVITFPFWLRRASARTAMQNALG